MSILTQPSEAIQRRLAYLLLRVAIGLSLTGHGLVRIPKLDAFRDSMTEQFASSIIPIGLVSVVGLVLPVAELVIGLTMTFGLLTPISLISGALSMIILVFGSTAIENWSAIGDQLLHLIPVIALLAFPRFNTYSADHLWLHRPLAAPIADGAGR
ncbi:DoxX family protein [Nocardia wallacei]|uniref:DoxX family protein n=1 Tax=Nocardia wallacei TaxID=480035 RepID=UPI00245558E3|nr:hypothetical protein [Nocardia wallacei]